MFKLSYSCCTRATSALPATKAWTGAANFEHEEQFEAFDKAVALAQKRAEITIASSLVIYPIGRDFLNSTIDLRSKSELKLNCAKQLRLPSSAVNLCWRRMINYSI